MNFANIFIWKDSEHPRWTILNGNLCVLVEPDFEAAVFPAAGRRRPRPGDDRGLPGAHAPRLSRVPEAFVRRFGAGFREEEDPDNFDYSTASRT